MNYWTDGPQHATVHIWGIFAIYVIVSLYLVGVVTNQTFGAARYKGVLLQARQVKCASNAGLPNATVQGK